MKVYRRLDVEQFKKRENEFWIYSYADMITNLMTFFIMLLVMMQMNPPVFEKIKETLAHATGGRYEVPNQELANEITEILRGDHMDKHVAIEPSAEGLALVFEGGLFFESGEATLKEGAIDMLKKISFIINKTPKKFAIEVEGHTDDRPVVTSEVYPSNWELSSARAGSVIRALTNDGVRASRFRAVGMADTKPLLPNRDSHGKDLPENQEKNRRVVMRLTAR